MYYKTFDKLQMNEKIAILSELNLMYDLHTEKVNINTNGYKIVRKC